MNADKNRAAVSFRRRLDTLGKYRAAYTNYIAVVYHMLLNKYPFVARPRKFEGVVRINSPEHAARIHHLLWNTPFIEYDPVNDIATVKAFGVKLRGVQYGGDLDTVFGRDDYKFLDVKDRIVVDVGANIGDSAIYFTAKGAKKVLAFEPYPSTFKVAEENIRSNNLSASIVLINAAISGTNVEVVIDPDTIGTVSTPLRESKNGVKVQVLSLEEVISKYKINLAVLKLDCEGCEHDAILNSRDEVLRHFS